MIFLQFKRVHGEYWWIGMMMIIIMSYSYEALFELVQGAF